MLSTSHSLCGEFVVVDLGDSGLFESAGLPWVSFCKFPWKLEEDEGSRGAFCGGLQGGVVVHDLINGKDEGWHSRRKVAQYSNLPARNGGSGSQFSQPIIGHVSHRNQPLRYPTHYTLVLFEVAYMQPSSPAIMIGCSSS
ncbi:hypothetical protein V8G54_007439 [Vigna mungo]|uniref:Uncharacterized protein n=1 Tax=Vigna mungo TaxID=3915 RepID=A0AAQ3S7B9_VIGMU